MCVFVCNCCLPVALDQQFVHFICIKFYQFGDGVFFICGSNQFLFLDIICTLQFAHYYVTVFRCTQAYLLAASRTERNVVLVGHINVYLISSVN